MSKKEYGRVTPQLVKRVEAVLAEANNHKYSVSRVYAAHNEAFQINDQPQTCSSCLRNRVRELRVWLKGYKSDSTPPVNTVDILTRLGLSIGDTPEEEASALKTAIDACVFELTEDEIIVLKNRLYELKPVDQYDDPTAPGHVAPPLGVTRYPMGEDAVPIDFKPSKDDKAKGTVLYADGSKIKAGTYSTNTGHSIAVQPGGKATIKTEDLT